MFLLPSGTCSGKDAGEMVWLKATFCGRSENGVTSVLELIICPESTRVLLSKGLD